MRLLSPITRHLNLTTKLTLSYTAATILPLLLVELIGVVIVFVMTIVIAVLPVVISGAIFGVSYLLRPYFASTPPDAAGAQEWLDSHLELGTDSTNPAWLYVLDLDRTILAQTPHSSPSDDPPAMGGLDELIPLVKSGVKEPDKLYSVSSKGVLTVLAPISDDQDQLAGYLVFVVPFFSPTEMYRQILTAVGQNLICFTLIAGLFGTGFGYIAVRALTRRLKTIAQTATDWGQGNFSHLNTDPSNDEIGKLAKQLNEVAGELQTVLKTKEELSALEERNRLARDLHDSVKQQVFAITMQLGAARTLIDQNPEAAKTHLLEAEQLAHQTRDELGVLINQLRPVALEGRSVTTALRDYVNDWSRQTKIKVTSRIEGEPALDEIAEQTLLRIAQEALSNVARHSRANEVQLTLTQPADSVTLTISDNGQGFEMGKVAKGVGLDSMRERMETIGGSLSVESRPGGGTTLTATARTKGINQ
jgi:NarL family two-component system sensor histidine kinase LiaS